MVTQAHRSLKEDAPQIASVEITLAPPGLRALDRQIVARELEVVNRAFDLERLREIDRSLRNLSDTEATRDDVAQMFDVVMAWGRGGRYREALPIATKALLLARALNEPALLRSALNARAMVADGAMDVGTSIGCLIEALLVAEKLNDVYALVVTFNNLGAACGHIALHLVSLTCYEKAIAILQQRRAELSDERLGFLQCATHCNISDGHLQLGDYRAAVVAARLSRQAAECALPNLPPTLKGQATDFLSLSRRFELSALVRLGMLDAADQLAAEVTESLDRGKLSIRSAWDSRMVLAEYSAARGSVDVAIAELRRVVAAPDAPNPRDAMVALAGCYESKGLSAMALCVLQELQADIEGARREVALEELRRIDGLEPAHDDNFDQFTRRRIAACRIDLEGVGIRLSSKLRYLTELAVSAEIREGGGQDEAGHIYRVGALSSLLAAEAGCDEDLCWLAELAGRLHDIGKSSIPDRIALKTQPLSDAEWTIVRGHSNYGSLLVADVGEPQLVQVVAAVRHHHERFAGGGYPNNLKGEEIPLLARIVAIAESFDAMLQSRTHRLARSISTALEEIERGAGNQYDPRLAGLFVQIVRRLQREVSDLRAYLGEQGRSSPAVQTFAKLSGLFKDR
jgi:putative two-component system response regulator